MKLTKQRLIEIIKEEYQNILNEDKRVRMGDVDIVFDSSDRDRTQILGRKGRLLITRQDAKTIKYVVQKEFSIYESTGELNEKIIKTKTGLEVELTRKGKYELLRLWMHKRKGYVEFHGRPEITNFMKILIKNLKIV